MYTSLLWQMLHTSIHSYSVVINAYLDFNVEVDPVCFDESFGAFFHKWIGCSDVYPQKILSADSCDHVSP